MKLQTDLQKLMDEEEANNSELQQLAVNSNSGGGQSNTHSTQSSSNATAADNNPNTFSYNQSEPTGMSLR